MNELLLEKVLERPFSQKAVCGCAGKMLFPALHPHTTAVNGGFGVNHAAAKAA
jgi:hypothetical protein